MIDQIELQFILGMSIKRDREKKTLFIIVKRSTWRAF